MLHFEQLKVKDLESELQKRNDEYDEQTRQIQELRQQISQLQSGNINNNNNGQTSRPRFKVEISNNDSERERRDSLGYLSQQMFQKVLEAEQSNFNNNNNEDEESTSTEPVPSNNNNNNNNINDNENDNIERSKIWDNPMITIPMVSLFIQSLPQTYKEIIWHRHKHLSNNTPVVLLDILHSFIILCIYLEDASAEIPSSMDLDIHLQSFIDHIQSKLGHNKLALHHIFNKLHVWILEPVFQVLSDLDKFYWLGKVRELKNTLKHENLDHLLDRLNNINDDYNSNIPADMIQYALIDNNNENISDID